MQLFKDEGDVKANAKILLMRKLHIDQSVVRVMKTRTKLIHSQLIAEVTKQLMARFTPDPKMIKQRISNLIDDDYMEKIKINGKPGYVYVP